MRVIFVKYMEISFLMSIYKNWGKYLKFYTKGLYAVMKIIRVSM